MPAVASSAARLPSPKPSIDPQGSVIYQGDPAFHAAVNRFIEVAAVWQKSFATTNLTIRSESLGGLGAGTVGTCDTTVPGAPTVTIDPAFWQAADQIAQTVLMFHLLGHCLMGRAHDPTLQADGSPESLMYPIVLTEQAFWLHSGGYMEEAFTAPPGPAPQPTVWIDTTGVVPAPPPQPLLLLPSPTPTL